MKKELDLKTAKVTIAILVSVIVIRSGFDLAKILKEENNSQVQIERCLEVAKEVNQQNIIK